MDTRRALLDAPVDGPVSGPALADDLGVSRAAIWKAVESPVRRSSLSNRPRRGTSPRASRLPAAGIQFGLDAPYAVEYHDRLPSTNDRARELAGKGPTGSRSSPTSRPVAGDDSTASGSRPAAASGSRS